MTEIRPVILCGGLGRRLYPFSHPHRPKPFLSVNGRRTLLEDTVDRLTFFGRPLLVLRQDLVASARDVLGDYGDICAEPAAQGTAIAILRAASHAGITPDTVLMIAPADHVIDPVDRYHEALRRAVDRIRAHPDHLLLIGVSPRAPSPQFGYMWRDDSGAVRFQEKPSRSVARTLICKGAVWNTGHVIAKAGTILQATQTHAPDLITALGQERDQKTCFGSFDHRILQKNSQTDFVRGDFVLHDIGTTLTYLGACVRSLSNR